MVFVLQELGTGVQVGVGMLRPNHLRSKEVVEQRMTTLAWIGFTRMQSHFLVDRRSERIGRITKLMASELKLDAQKLFDRNRSFNWTQWNFMSEYIAVSYTHLTLPTICSV